MLKDDEKMTMTDHDLDRIRSITANGLNILEQRFNAGEDFALMNAIAMCASRCYPLPAWVRGAYLSAFSKVRGFEARSWDDVFGKPLPKGKGLSAARRRLYGTWDVLIEVQRILREEPGTPIDEYLFERVAETLKLKPSMVKDYYYDAKVLTGM